MLGTKSIFPPTDATDCFVATQLSQSYKHSKSAEMLENQAFRYFLMFGGSQGKSASTTRFLTF